MRPVLEFLPPEQSATHDTPTISWWHILITVKDAGILHKRCLARAEVWATRYLRGKQVGEGIALRWRTRDGPSHQELLECGGTYHVPFAFRDEIDGKIIITNDDAFQRKFKWALTRDGFYRWDELIHGPNDVKELEWKIEVRRPAQKAWQSPRSYVLSIPEVNSSNDTFRLSVL